MTADLQTPPRAGSAPGVLSLVLTLCLLLAVAATALGLPAVVRTPPALPGVLLAPGYAWLSLARWRTGQPARTATALALALVLSLGLLPLVGVAVGAVGLPVSPVTVGAGLLLLTLPPTGWVLLAQPAHPAARVVVPPRASWRPAARRLLPTALALAVFAGAVGWAASWQERPDSGPYTGLAYVGELADLTGPVDVRPGEQVPLPVRLERSDGQPWTGLLTVSVDGRAQDARTVRLTAGDVVTLQAGAPGDPGLHDATVNAVDDRTGEELSLTLRLQVGEP
ncbi:hypothetical protein [Geodermatophilus sp. URMC 63]